MSLTFIVIPLCLLLIAINLYFRYVILGKFRKLADKNVDIELGEFINRKKRVTYINNHYPSQKQELMSLGKSMDRLIFSILTIIVILLAFFILRYFTQ